MLGPRPGPLVAAPLTVDVSSPKASPRSKALHRASTARTADRHPRAVRSESRAVRNEWLNAASLCVHERLSPTAPTAWLDRARGACVRVRLPDGTQAPGTLGAAVDGSMSPARHRPAAMVMASDGSNSAFDQWTVTLKDGKVITAATSQISRIAPAKGQTARVVLGALAGFAGVVLGADGDVAVVRAHLDRRVKVLPLDALTLDRTA